MHNLCEKKKTIFPYFKSSENNCQNNNENLQKKIQLLNLNSKHILKLVQRIEQHGMSSQWIVLS